MNLDHTHIPRLSAPGMRSIYMRETDLPVARTSSILESQNILVDFADDYMVVGVEVLITDDRSPDEIMNDESEWGPAERGPAKPS